MDMTESRQARRLRPAHDHRRSARFVRLSDRVMEACFGTTKHELEMRLPGDDLVAQPVLESTHAITIGALADRKHVSGELSVAFVLVPLAGRNTRVLRRTRAACNPLLYRLLAVPVRAHLGRADHSETLAAWAEAPR